MKTETPAKEPIKFASIHITDELQLIADLAGSDPVTIINYFIEALCCTEETAANSFSRLQARLMIKDLVHPANQVRYMYLLEQLNFQYNTEKSNPEFRYKRDALISEWRLQLEEDKPVKNSDPVIL